VKKGRHRRYEEARKAKQGIPVPLIRCEECGGDSVHGHAQWCMAYLDDDELQAASSTYGYDDDSEE
jgi:hypothetical protein